MSADIRVSAALFGHAKIIKLRRRLGADGVLSLIQLWTYAAQNRPKGELFDMTDEDIAIAAGWTGDERTFVSALIDLRLLDARDAGYAIHDWIDHQRYVAFSEVRSEAGRRAAAARWSREKCEPHGKTCELHSEKCDPHAVSHAPVPVPVPVPVPDPIPDPDPDPDPLPNTLGPESAAPPPPPAEPPAATAPATAPSEPFGADCAAPCVISPDDIGKAFDRVKAIYPKRAGAQNWKQAEAAFRKRVKSGEPLEVILAGTQAYAAYVTATDRAGTQWVKQASTFFGPDQHYREDWTPPPDGKKNGVAPKSKPLAAFLLGAL